MSLILAARFQDGILLASDPFVFNNDGELPIKHIQFNKLYISKKLKSVFASVGSSWVFNEFTSWIEANNFSEANTIEKISNQWAYLNKLWKDQRESDTLNLDNHTLRPLSDSILVSIFEKDLNLINIFDSNGNKKTTSQFVFSGSGSLFVENYLRESKKSFNPTDSLTQCVDLIFECYNSAYKDLYVIGTPSMAVIVPEKTINYAEECSLLWQKNRKQYFDEIKEAILRDSFRTA